MSRLERIEDVLVKAQFKANQSFIRTMRYCDEQREKIIAECGIEYVEAIDKEISDARH